jgi:hypothetical protein
MWRAAISAWRQGYKGRAGDISNTALFTHQYIELQHRNAFRHPRRFPYLSGRRCGRHTVYLSRKRATGFLLPPISVQGQPLTPAKLVSFDGG